MRVVTNMTLKEIVESLSTKATPITEKEAKEPRVLVVIGPLDETVTLIPSSFLGVVFEFAWFPSVTLEGHLAYCVDGAPLGVS